VLFVLTVENCRSLLLIVDVKVRVQSVLKQQKNRSSVDQTSERDRAEWYVSREHSCHITLHSSPMTVRLINSDF